jgi:hypothetical protein
MIKICKNCGKGFDHIKGEKEFNVCNAKSVNQAKKEIKKCEVVC